MKFTSFLLCSLFFSELLFSQSDMSVPADPQALRIDLTLAGNSQETNVYLDNMLQEPYWSGSPSSTIDALDFGIYRIAVTDRESGALVYSNGFCSLFQEWQTTAEAKQLKRSFEQVVRIPFPSKPVHLSLLQRMYNGTLVEIFSLDIDPASMFISKEKPMAYPVSQIVTGGDYRYCLDIAFIAEGYTANQMDKFRADVKSMADYLFAQAPFNKYASKINVWAIESPSEGEGADNPGTGYWNRTPVGSSLYTFGIDRYLTTTRHKQVMDVAANAPADVVYVLVNTPVYGGGGIYNHYNVATSDHPLSKLVFIHELGHGLAGLGDEYFDSSVAYEGYYNLLVEPWEPNLTTMVNFAAKWKDMIPANVPVPTPPTAEYKSEVGAFEGGGYVTKGVYRPAYDCRMRTNSASGFCPVCQRAIERVIETYVK
ncbi:MAG: peptidase M64 [Bacteroidales bacterium]|nr:peptidase M64 [Bacteroidales bacterium]MBN2750421.1 peptidase M64 [Bacteroidales bacterium]